MFGAVALLVLLIACLNYMNLSTAAAFKRTREIGTRKTLGARKGQLIGQFTSEAFILATLALFIAIAFVQILLPVANGFLKKDLNIFNLPLSWIASIGGALAGSAMLSTLYPAFVISRIVPTEAMKREVKLGNSSLPVRTPCSSTVYDLDYHDRIYPGNLPPTPVHEE